MVADRSGNRACARPAGRDEVRPTRIGMLYFSFPSMSFATTDCSQLFLPFPLYSVLCSKGPH